MPALRSRPLLVAVVVVAIVVGAGVAWPASRHALSALLPKRFVVAVNAWRFGYRIEPAASIPARDGTRLAASVYLPDDRAGGLATVLIRLHYGRLVYGEGLNFAEKFARAGYAVVIEDLRGTGGSGGELVPYAHGIDDGAATLDWITAQPWSNGRVGTFGCSGLGESQYVLSRAHHPALRAMVPLGAGGAIGTAAGRYSYFGVFEGGIFELASGFGWFVDNGSRLPDAPVAAPFDIASVLRGLPVADLVHRVRPAPNGYDDFMRGLADPGWHDLGYLDATDRVDVPKFEITTWGDQTVGDTLAFEGAQSAQFERAGKTRPEHHLVIAPGTHCHAEESAQAGQFGALPVRHAELPYLQWYERWFDHWLRERGDGLAALPPVLYFMLGEDAWYAAPSWPPPQARVEQWDLDSDGQAHGTGHDAGAGRLSRTPPAHVAFDEILDDPQHPVPSRGGPVCCTGNVADVPGPYDQHEVEARADVLSYTSGVLAEPLRIAGPLRARLVVSSSAPDADFVARLVDVDPAGHAISLQEGAMRARYAPGFERPQALVAGRPIRLDVDMRAIAVTIAAGHRLRLDIASSSFPRLERNLHVEGDNERATTTAPARNRVLHGGDMRSWIELPVLSPEAARAAGAAAREAIGRPQTS